MTYMTAYVALQNGTSIFIVMEKLKTMNVFRANLFTYYNLTILVIPMRHINPLIDYSTSWSLKDKHDNKGYCIYSILDFQSYFL